MKRPYYMDSTTAKEFGVIDKVSAMLLDCYVLWLFTSCGKLTNLCLLHAGLVAWSRKDYGRCSLPWGLGQECWCQSCRWTLVYLNMDAHYRYVGLPLSLVYHPISLFITIDGEVILYSWQCNNVFFSVILRFILCHR